MMNEQLDYESRFRFIDLKAEMNLWRKGLTSLPTTYINLHEQAARASFTELAEVFGLKVRFSEMVSEGWGDGMKVLRVIAETADGEVRSLKWSTANGGSWFTTRGALFYIPTENPGHI
jgi:hypothetical protein